MKSGIALLGTWMFLAATAAAATVEGALLLHKPANRKADFWIIDLESSRATPLPRSPLSSARTEKTDGWYGGSASDTLVRVDASGGVDLFGRSTLTRVGGFSLDRLPGVDKPKFYGPVKPSPDGQYLLTYWLPDYRDNAPTIVVFDRRGGVVDSGSPYRYDRSAHSGAFDWLPDGGFIYLAGDKLVLRTLNSKIPRVAPIQFPKDVNTRGANLAVSPDGQRLLWSLAATVKNKSGSELVHGLLYVSNLDGTGMRALTSLSARAQQGAVRWFHSRPAWSPSGKLVAFSVNTTGAYGAMPYFNSGCPKVYVVRADAREVPIDGLDDAPDLQLNTVRERDAGLRACRGSLLWLSR